MVLQRSTEINVLTNKLTGILLLSLDLSHKDLQVTQPDTIAQLLLRQQFPQLPGLQDVSLGQTMAFNVVLVNLCKYFAS